MPQMYAIEGADSYYRIGGFEQVDVVMYYLALMLPAKVILLFDPAYVKS